MNEMRISAGNDGLLDGRTCTTVELDWDGPAPQGEELPQAIAAAARHTTLPHPLGGEADAIVIQTRPSSDRITLGYLLYLGAAVQRLAGKRRPSFWAIAQGESNVAVRLYPKGPPRGGERERRHFKHRRNTTR